MNTIICSSRTVSKISVRICKEGNFIHSITNDKFSKKRSFKLVIESFSLPINNDTVHFGDSCHDQSLDRQRSANI